jgi:hypothetical protein
MAESRVVQLDLESAWDQVAKQVTPQNAHDAATAGAWDVTGLVERGVRVAAPILVAAELRRIVFANSNPGDWGGIRYTDLLARADELDPAGCSDTGQEG